MPVLPRPHIAIVSRNATGQTGSVNKIRSHACNFAAQGWDVTVVAARIRMEGVPRERVSTHRIGRPWWLWGQSERTVFRDRAQQWVAQRGFDLVVGHGDLLHQDVAHLHNCVHLAHELIEGAPLPVDDANGAMHAAILRRQSFRALIANSRLMRDDVASRFGVDPRIIHVIHPGYDPLRFDRDDRERLGRQGRAFLGIPDGRLVIGFITSGSFRKRGLDVLIRAFASLPAEVRAVAHIAVVGRDRKITDYVRQAQVAGIGDRFTAIDRQDAIENFHHAMDLFALPARIEEFGQSAQEAMVCGVPAIVSDRMGIVERLPADARSGVVPADDPAALADTLRRFLTDPTVRRAWAEIGYRACTGNTWQMNWRSHLPIYQDILEAKRAESGLQRAAAG